MDRDQTTIPEGFAALFRSNPFQDAIGFFIAPLDKGSSSVSGSPTSTATPGVLLTAASL